MKETIFFSFLGCVVLSLSGGDHMKAQCWLVEGSKGSKNSTCHPSEMCTGRCDDPLMLPRPVVAVEFLDPIVINVNFVLDFQSLNWCYRKMVFILLISESRRLLCDKIELIQPFPGGNIFLS